MPKKPVAKKLPYYDHAPKNMAVWKKVYWLIDDKYALNYFEDSKPCLVKLMIIQGTRIRLHEGFALDHRKCRAAKAKVLGFFTLKGKPLSVGKKIFFSRHDKYFYYELNKEVRPSNGFDRSCAICAAGIHFFLKRADAAKYIP